MLAASFVVLVLGSLSSRSTGCEASPRSSCSGGSPRDSRARPRGCLLGSGNTCDGLAPRRDGVRSVGQSTVAQGRGTVIRPVHGIVVAYGGAEQLDRCLAALERTIDVTVIDNSSSPEVRAVARDRGAEYLDPGANLGFGAGVNRRAQTTDVRAGPGHPAPQPRRGARAARPASTGCARLHDPGEHRTSRRSLRGSFAPTVSRNVSSGRSRLRSGRGVDAVGLGRWLPARDTFVIGAVLLLRWEAVQAVGLFDERFFLYSEETDWQRRASALGWKSEVCEDVRHNTPARARAQIHCAAKRCSTRGRRHTSGSGMDEEVGGCTDGAALTGAVARAAVANRPATSRCLSNERFSTSVGLARRAFPNESLRTDS